MNAIAAEVVCPNGCGHDETAVLAVTVEKLLEAIELGPLAWDGKGGYAVVPELQSTIANLVDERQGLAVALETYRELEPWSVDDVDTILGFLIVLRDAILAHRGAPVTLKVWELGAE